MQGEVGTCRSVSGWRSGGWEAGEFMPGMDEKALSDRQDRAFIFQGALIPSMLLFMA